MSAEEKLKIPTTHMPENWREIGAQQFNLSQSTIEKVVYGLSKNKKVFEYMLSLAEAGKKAHDAQMDRLNALTN